MTRSRRILGDQEKEGCDYVSRSRKPQVDQEQEDPQVSRSRMTPGEQKQETTK